MSESDPRPLLSVKNLSYTRADDQLTFTDISFDVYDGETIVLSGKSGSGKTTLLKCLAHLDVYKGNILLHGRKPSSYGIPRYRALVLYVPQRSSLLPSTPRDFLQLVSSYKSRAAFKTTRKEKSRWGASPMTSLPSLTTANEATPGAMHGPVRIAEEWGIDEKLWDRPWASLSGGESQRIALAVAVGLKGAEILLLDEPTSALDAETMDLVEATLQRLIGSKDSTVRAIIWITHSEEQGRRVGTRYLYIEDGGCLETLEMGLPPSRQSQSQTQTPRNSSPGPD